MHQGVSHAALEQLRSNASALTAVLAGLGIEQVFVTYRGTQESGLVREVAVVPAAALAGMQTIRIALPQVSPPPAEDGAVQVATPEPQSLPLVEAVKAFALSWMALRHPYWGNDDGCSGRMEINVSRRTFTLDHEAWVIDHYHYQLEG